MVIYLGTYAWLYGWKFAVALVYLIFIHEMGHASAARKLKIPTSQAIFIPFVGAGIALKEKPKNAKDEAILAYMGPFFGLLSFLPAIPLYVYTQDPFWGLVIFLGGIINLFNLIPITPLDGGRIAAGISTKLWAAGLVILLSYSIYRFSFLGIFIVIIGAIEWKRIYQQQKNLHTEQQEIAEYYSMNFQLQEHAKVASIDNFVYYAQSFKRMIKNADLQDTFQVLDEIEDMDLPEEQAKLKVDEFLHKFREQVDQLNGNYRQTASYYQTTKKTKLTLFFLYAGLAIVLAIGVYYGNEIMMDSDEMKNIIGS